MKTTNFFFLVLLSIGITNLNAQSTDPQSTIAVSNPNVTSLSIKTESAARMMRLELIKLNKYKVYDEFDMADVIKTNPDFSNNCYGQNCLVRLGEALNTDYVMSGSLDLLGNKIAISLKIIDVKNKTIHKSTVREFDNQELEIQRMIEILLKDMHGITPDKVLVDRLAFKNEVITSNNLGKINNSGPRIGAAAMTGSLNEFATRSEDRGGLGIAPFVSMIGYQLEGQYVGTENFSALVEGVFNISGLEQGQFIPSFIFMNGFRFGKGNWEFAFGPGFGLKRVSNGFFDTENKFGTDEQYFSEGDWYSYANANYYSDPQYNTNGYFIAPTPSQASGVTSGYDFSKSYFDKRGSTKLNTSFVFAFGKTFKAGALNIPVNLFYSSQKGGGYVGFNVGFNVLKSKKDINNVN
ncbi:MAG: hypothetical protein RLZ10_953 [Bacteroidota bacterium]|jgi:hypothetical protein